MFQVYTERHVHNQTKNYASPLFYIDALDT